MMQTIPPPGSQSVRTRRVSRPATGRCVIALRYWSRRTHGRTTPRAVRIMRNILVILAGMTQREGAAWIAQARAEDERAQALGGQEVTMEWDVGPHATMIDFRGYAYTRSPSEISGGTVTRYDPRKPQIWHVPLQDQVVAKSSTLAPRGGYIVPAAEAAWLSERLSLHGIRFERLATSHAQASVETFRATKATFSPSPSEGRTTVEIDGSWGSEHRDVPAGSLYVPIAQPGSRLILALLEPQSSDSFCSLGLLQRGVRGARIHGGVRERAGGRADAGQRSAARRRIQTPSRQRTEVRRRPRGATRILLSPSSVVGRSVPPVSDLSGGREALTSTSYRRAPHVHIRYRHCWRRCGGIAAARWLRANGSDALLLEARERIGGRAHTDSSTLGMPLDHGCAWLHSAAENPWAAVARESDFPSSNSRRTGAGVSARRSAAPKSWPPSVTISSRISLSRAARPLKVAMWR